MGRQAAYRALRIQRSLGAGRTGQTADGQNYRKAARQVWLPEAEACGGGIKMRLLSQGRWTRAVGPPEFVEEMRGELEAMRELYG